MKTFVDGRRAGFVIVANDVLDYANLAPYDLAVYVHIIRFANFQSGEAWPSVGTLAQKAGMSDRQVQKSLKALVEQGLLRVERRDNASNLYTLLDFSLEGVNHVHPPGEPCSPPPVNHVHPNKTYSEQNPMNKSTPAPSSAAPSKPVKNLLSAEENAALVALINAYLDATGSVQKTLYRNKTVRAEALALHSAGIRPADVQAYVVYLKRDAFWRDKGLPWSKIAQGIISWKCPQGKPRPTELGPDYVPSKED